MGGFRFNGCGATDHFKKIRSLGIHMCPKCKRASEFFLEEAKFKIDVFFIPTVTLKTRYAVMCGKCREGELCSDQWAVNLLNGTGPLPVIFESQAQEAVQPAVSQETASSVPETISCDSSEQAVQQPVSKGVTAPLFFKCPHCGITQLREGAFCSFCGKPAPEESSASGSDAKSSSERVCPGCGTKIEGDASFCMECGMKLG